MAVSAQELLDEAERLKALHEGEPLDFGLVAFLVLSERERCANVAQNYRDDNPFPTVYGAIAAAIRTPVREGV